MIVGVGSVASMAQTMYDALDLGKDNYYGTARTMGMGNAVTAVGADLGSIALNPAGSAVAGYSQFSISQGVTISSTASSWAAGYSEYDGNQVFSGTTKGTRAKYIMPNVGFNLRLDTGESSGIKSWNFAFLSTMTNNFCDKAIGRGYNAFGTNPQYTSMSGALAVGAMFNSDGAGSMLDPDMVWAGADVTVGRDTVLLPMTMLWGKTTVGEACTLGPNVRLTDTTVADGCTVEETVAIGQTITN